MPSVLDRSALEQSPLADLHLLANELGVDGFRRLRKPDLVDAILARQSGDAPAAVAEGVDAGASIVRVHDVAAVSDFLAVRAVLRGERELGPLEGLSPERYPDGVPPHLALG